MIELLAATIIIGIISFALTESLVSGLNNTGATQERLTGSIDRQRVASAFVPDAQSTQDVVSGTPCGDPLGPSGQIVKGLELFDDGDAKVAWYFTDGSDLLRRLCTNADAGEDEALAEIGDGLVPAILPGDYGRISLRMCPVDEATCLTKFNYDVSQPRPEGLPRGYEVVATRKVFQ